MKTTTKLALAATLSACVTGATTWTLSTPTLGLNSSNMWYKREHVTVYRTSIPNGKCDLIYDPAIHTGTLVCYDHFGRANIDEIFQPTWDEIGAHVGLTRHGRLP